jgi:hypothetical protein
MTKLISWGILARSQTKGLGWQMVFLGSCCLWTAIIAGTGCGRPAEPGASTQTPSLIGAYRFEIPESSQPSSISVVFSGQLNAAPATVPDTKFSVTTTAQVDRGPGKGSVSLSVANLRPGSWTVTATPNGFGAPVTCEAVTVPGSVTLSVVQGEHRCGP